MIEELLCRIVSIVDYILRKDQKYLILDKDKNQYIRGRQYKAQKIDNQGFKKEDGWHHVMTHPNGVKFYIKGTRGSDKDE